MGVGELLLFLAGTGAAVGLCFGAFTLSRAATRRLVRGRARAP